MTERDRIARYLEGLARLCFETSRNPRLLPYFLRVLQLVPCTVRELICGKPKRIAA